MSKPTTQLEELSYDDQYDTNIEDDDYGFIVGPDGELKHLFTPNDFELDPPPVVRKILKLLGIDDINSIGFDGDDTLH